MLRRGFICLVVTTLVAIYTNSSVEAGGGGNGTRITIPLVGTNAARLASGKAKFEQQGSRRKFSVEGEDLRAFNGGKAAISVDGRQVGSVPIRLGGFDLNLDTRNGQSVPSVGAASRIVVTVSGKSVLTSR